MKPYTQRLFRFWLIVCIPLSAYFGYLSYDNSVNAAYHDEQVHHWYKELDNKDLIARGIIDPRERFELHARFRDESKKNIEKFLIYSVAILFLPLIIWLALLASRWIWDGKVSFKR